MDAQGMEEWEVDVFAALDPHGCFLLTDISDWFTVLRVKHTYSKRKNTKISSAK